MNYRTIPELLISLHEKYGSSMTPFKFKIDGKWEHVTHETLREKVENFALGLLNLGIKAGDRIGIVSENRVEWIISDLAIASIGAISVPLFTTLTAKQEEFIFNDCQAVGVIVSNTFQLAKVVEVKDNISSLRHIIIINEQFESQDINVKSMKYVSDRGSEIRTPQQRREIILEYSAKVNPEDLLTVIYTSGTTGNPKGVMLTHNNMVSNAIASKHTTKFDESDIFLSYLPFCHSFERIAGYYVAFSSGATIYIAESIDAVAGNIKEAKPTFMTTVPKLMEMVRKKIISAADNDGGAKQKIFHWALDTGLKYVHAKLNNNVSFFLQTKYKLADSLVFSKIREKIGCEKLCFVSGGAALAAEVFEFFLAIGYGVLEGYGLTESSPALTITRVENLEPGTVGMPLDNVEIKIAEDGEILARGPNIMKGYWNDERATMEAIDEDGWLYTGDIGILTEKGNLKITDRKKNIFVSSGGKNIAPQPIENLLSQSSFIEQCILIGDRREFNTALITPDFGELQKLAKNVGINFENPTELIANEKIIKVIKDDIDRLQKDLAKFERVRKFKLLSEPFTIESGLLTPKMSIRRHVVEKKYNDLIEQMYGMK